jgi:DNA-binding response OmpR family regulator
MSRVDPPSRKPVALVVDDDTALQGLFNTLLGKNGFSVDRALNGRQAFECIRRGNYSVILLDLMMPEVSGFELLERLQRESPSLLRRVIVITGAAQRVVDELDASTVWGLVRKPFDVNDLLSSARACADGAPRRGNA